MANLSVVINFATPPFVQVFSTQHVPNTNLLHTTWEWKINKWNSALWEGSTMAMQFNACITDNYFQKIMSFSIDGIPPTNQHFLILDKHDSHYTIEVLWQARNVGLGLIPCLSWSGRRKSCPNWVWRVVALLTKESLGFVTWQSLVQCILE